MEPTANDGPVPTLYRMFDRDDQLLYVGLTYNFLRRVASHAAQSPWFPEVCRIQEERLPTWRGAMYLEARAIRHEAPKYNIVRGMWRHIADDIQDQIRDGSLRPGDKLPTKREMAVQYGVSIAVVDNAMIELRTLKLIRGVQGKAVYVAERPDRPTPKE